MRYGELALNMVPPFVKLQSDIEASENQQLSVEVQAYDIEQDNLTYSWKQLAGPNVLMENENTPKITFKVPKLGTNDTLKLEVLVDDGEYSISDTISISYLVTGINQLNNNNLKIYPNPVSDYITVVCDNNLVLSAKLYSLIGTLIEQWGNKSILNVTDIPNGLYMLEITDQNSTFKVVEKIIITK